MNGGMNVTHCISFNRCIYYTDSLEKLIVSILVLHLPLLFDLFLLYPPLPGKKKTFLEIHG